MLHLAAPTRPGWLPQVRAGLDELLVDHAHCEKKAAGVAVQLLFQHPGDAELAAALAPLAREELEHLEQVLARLRARGVALRPLAPAPYAARLHAAVRRDPAGRLLDTLLCAALIEARSCERMQRLAETLADPGPSGEAPEPALAAFYADLLASEARHHALYVELAVARAGRPAARARLDELARHEAASLAPPAPWPRMHG